MSVVVEVEAAGVLKAKALCIQYRRKVTELILLFFTAIILRIWASKPGLGKTLAIKWTTFYLFV